MCKIRLGRNNSVVQNQLNKCNTFYSNDFVRKMRLQNINEVQDV